MRTQVAIIGAGPAGVLLSHLLAADGVDSVIVEARTEDYVLARIRAGILEHASVELLRSVGLGDRLAQNGIEHRGIYLQTPGDRHHLDFVDLVGRNVWVYGQTEVQRDLVAAAMPEGNRSSTAPTTSLCTTSPPTDRMSPSPSTVSRSASKPA
jgi:p-hydroxybenzoate 3-monooxygenase